MLEAPAGIKPDISLTEIVPKDSWAIWFATASGAIAARLSPAQIQAAPLPQKTKQHLAAENLTALKEVLAAWKI
jgi:hypothetical protein